MQLTDAVLQLDDLGVSGLNLIQGLLVYLRVHLDLRTQNRGLRRRPRMRIEEDLMCYFTPCNNQHSSSVKIHMRTNTSQHSSSLLNANVTGVAS